MLNTDLHDPRLRSGKSSRRPMSLDQFVSNLRGVDEGRNFPRAFLKNMFNRIQERAIEWKEEGHAADDGDAEQRLRQQQKRRSSGSAGSAASGAQAQQQLEGAARAAANQVRIVSQKLSHALVRQRTWLVPGSGDTWLVAPLYDSSWFRALGTFSLLRDQEPHLGLCLDGLAFGAAIAIALGPSLQPTHTHTARAHARTHVCTHAAHAKRTSDGRNNHPNHQQ